MNVVTMTSSTIIKQWEVSNTIGKEREKVLDSASGADSRY